MYHNSAACNESTITWAPAVHEYPLVGVFGGNDAESHSRHGQLCLPILVTSTQLPTIVMSSITRHVCDLTGALFFIMSTTQPCDKGNDVIDRRLSRVASAMIK